ncbi:BlaI/MecI/CopY family transcriptional regulator [Agaribacterium haliotis]|uniref:BlaI/MecI/CopY family transcriptional regulator n=1 Tax=Agaribacterium haliotis TaxID=2013869 RepID=UPI000BB5543B|nr:BlaI/MecI/CopY family transcriptional regulator [Agaribacterium haliotis]
MPQPTSPELALLKCLWKSQPQTARELHNEVGVQQQWSYSSTRKVLERMGEKGLVVISDQGNKKIYRAKVEKLSTLAAYARDFARRVLELEGPIPAALFGSSHLVNKDELAELENLINEADKQLESKQGDGDV